MSFLESSHLGDRGGDSWAFLILEKTPAEPLTSVSKQPGLSHPAPVHSHPHWPHHRNSSWPLLTASNQWFSTCGF